MFRVWFALVSIHRYWVIIATYIYTQVVVYFEYFFRFKQISIYSYLPFPKARVPAHCMYIYVCSKPTICHVRTITTINPFSSVFISKPRSVIKMHTNTLHAFNHGTIVSNGILIYIHIYELNQVHRTHNRWKAHTLTFTLYVPYKATHSNNLFFSHNKTTVNITSDAR